ncbi:MAG: hypothetical protein J6U53_02455 [Tidjanibacter sp.]|nr:hypothetical protein [Tidjanibacter sp.]
MKQIGQTFRRVASLVVLILMMGALSGCKLISLSSFVLKDAKVLAFNLSEGATVEMTIENRSPFKVTVVGGKLVADIKGDPVGEVYMRTPVVLPRRSTVTVTFDVGLRFSSPMAALKALGKLSTSPDDLTISGYGEGKIWCFTKRYERSGVPISKFISIFGEPSKYLNK